MKWWIAFWNILVKDMRAYYLKPPTISWGFCHRSFPHQPAKYPEALDYMKWKRELGDVVDFREGDSSILSDFLIFFSTIRDAEFVHTISKGARIDSHQFSRSIFPMDSPVGLS